MLQLYILKREAYILLYSLFLSLSLQRLALCPGIGQSGAPPFRVNIHTFSVSGPHRMNRKPAVEHNDVTVDLKAADSACREPLALQ